MLKTIVAALAGASLLAIALPAAAQHHGGGWSHGSSAGSPSAGGGHSGVAAGGGFQRGGFERGGLSGATGFGASRFPGHGGFPGGFRPHFSGYRGHPYYFADFGLGFALGLSVLDPWYYDTPYYGGYYAPYAYGPPPSYYYPPTRSEAAPPPAEAAQASAPAACGSWAWDSDKQAYNWVPCAP